MANAAKNGTKIGIKRNISSPFEVADVRVGLLAAVVTSLDKLPMRSKVTNSPKVTDQFAVKDLFESNREKLAGYRDLFEPDYKMSVGTGGLSFVRRDYANNS